MYKTRFLQWGFTKHNTEKEIAKILHVKTQRDALGKRSRFTRNNKRLDIQQYLKRKGISEYDLVVFASPSALPQAVYCRSPSPEYLRSADVIRAHELFLHHWRECFQKEYLRAHDLEFSSNTSNSGRPGPYRWVDILGSIGTFMHRRKTDLVSEAWNQLQKKLDEMLDDGSLEDLVDWLDIELDNYPQLLPLVSKYLTAKLTKWRGSIRTTNSLHT